MQAQSPSGYWGVTGSQILSPCYMTEPGDGSSFLKSETWVGKLPGLETYHETARSQSCLSALAGGPRDSKKSLLVGIDSRLLLAAIMLDQE